MKLQATQSLQLHMLRHRVVVIAMAVAVAIFVASCDADDMTEPAVVELDARRLDVGGAPWGVAVTGEVVWVSDASRATLLELDEVDGRVRREVATGASDPRDAGLAVDGGRLWVANLGGSVGIVDATTGASLGRVAVSPGEPAAVEVSDGSVWAPRHGPGGGLSRIDVVSHRAQSIVLPESGFAVVVEEETVWVSGLDRDLFAVDVASRTVRLEVALPGAPRGVAFADGDVWVTLRDQRQVVRIDGGTGEVVGRIELEGEPWPIASGAGAVWVAELGGRLLRIDPVTEQITGSAAIGTQARAIAVGDAAVWVTGQAGTVTRVALDR
jgi:DNA-binding beta-propeller fold protein YncE